MKTILSGSSIFLVLITLYSCNLFSAVGMESSDLPIKKIKIQGINYESISQEIIDHSAWDKLLKEYVNAKGFVDYKGFKNEKSALEDYLKMLSENPPSNGWSFQELLAYYINLYNAATVNLIVENYPIKSIKDINRPWTKDRIQIGDKMISLDEIEHKVLRKMNEPRIHFAVNCASISCPRLIAEAYTTNKINEQLDHATAAFINSDENEISPNELKLSSIFKWYKKDFNINGKVDLIGFINEYSNVEINSSARITHKTYNWNLNEQ